MRTLAIIAACVGIVFLAGCRQTTEPAPSDMYVLLEVESAFLNDSVSLALDNALLLKSRITTNYSVDLAWSSGFQKLSRDRHSLSFTVIEYGVGKEYVINTAFDTSTVLLRFDKSTKQIDFQQFKGIMLRD